MTLPLTRTKVYTTALTADQLGALLSQLSPSGISQQFYPIDNYAAELSAKGFVLSQPYRQHRLIEMPKITGEILQAQPTMLHVKIIPNYFLLAFYLLFSGLFISGALFSDNWTINGVHRAPELTERLEIVLVAGGLPILICYVALIVPVKKAQDWLIEKLALH